MVLQPTLLAGKFGIPIILVKSAQFVLQPTFLARKFEIHIILVKMCTIRTATYTLSREIQNPYHFGKKVPNSYCNLYARAVIVTLGLGRPSAGRELHK